MQPPGRRTSAQHPTPDQTHRPSRHHMTQPRAQRPPASSSASASTTPASWSLYLSTPLWRSTAAVSAPVAAQEGGGGGGIFAQPGSLPSPTPLPHPALSLQDQNRHAKHHAPPPAAQAPTQAHTPESPASLSRSAKAKRPSSAAKRRASAAASSCARRWKATVLPSSSVLASAGSSRRQGIGGARLRGAAAGSSVSAGNCSPRRQEQLQREFIQPCPALPPHAMQGGRQAAAHLQRWARAPLAPAPAPPRTVACCSGEGGGGHAATMSSRVCCGWVHKAQGGKPGNLAVAPAAGSGQG